VRLPTTMGMVARLSLLLALACGLTFPAAVLGAARPYAWPKAYTAVAHNPADALADLPIESSTYDPATHCSSKPRPGMTALVGWLGAHAGGTFWGTYRCEKRGRHSASLHAENRAVDWHLDVTVPADRHEATRLIALLLAPDRAGNAQALARRMGVEKIIWDCGYWGAGMPQFRPYSACLTKHGRLRAAREGRSARAEHAETAEFEVTSFTDADWAILQGAWSSLGQDAMRAGQAGHDGEIDDDVAFASPWGFDLAAVEAPVLLAQGGEDRVIPPSHAYALLRALPRPELWLRPLDGHVSILHACPLALDWLLSAR
jgi:pimeloyl-ACP methyl ester carboxylesterase